MSPQESSFAFNASMERMPMQCESLSFLVCLFVCFLANVFVVLFCFVLVFFFQIKYNSVVTWREDLLHSVPVWRGSQCSINRDSLSPQEEENDDDPAQEKSDDGQG